MDKFIQKLKGVSSRGNVLTIGDLVTILEFNEFKNESIYCFCKGNKKNDYISSLSFFWNKNKITYVKSKKDINAILITYRKKQKTNKILESDGYILIINNYENEDIVKYTNLLKCCDIVRNGSLNIRNYNNDILALTLKKIKKDLISNPNFDLVDVERIIKNTQNKNCLHFYILPSGKTKSTNSKHKNVSCFHCLIENEFKNYLDESVKSGKPVVWNCNDIKNIFYYAIIPVVKKSDPPFFVKDFFLIWSPSNFFINTINNIIEIIDTFSNLKIQYNKISPVISLHSEIIQKYHDGSFGSRICMTEEFFSFSKKCLMQIVKTTYAHSVTVRQYDPHTKGLKLFQEVKTDWGKRDTSLHEDEYNIIKIKNFRSSLNAFTFLKNSERDSYSYIKNYNNKIPDEYKFKGLMGILRHRETTLSEICFPLFCGSIAFGTMNIESPIKNAFDDEIEYLQGMKHVLESHYDICLRANDTKWLANRSPVYRNVHELSQLLLPKRKLFNNDQIDILKKLIILDDSKESKITNNLKTIKDELETWVYLNNDPISSGKIISNFIFDIKEDVMVEKQKYDKIMIILKNIFDNIIDHGDLDRDKIIFVQNDHLRMGVNAKLKIFIKTFGSFDCDHDRLLLSPIEKDDRYHYGMFLVGMLARKLGGIALISDMDKPSPHTIIEISLPT